MSTSIDAPAIAILPWGNAIEDYLEPIGLDLDAFCTRMSGGWLFGYADALRIAGWRPFLVCVSRTVRSTERRQHGPSGISTWVLPLPRAYRQATAAMRDPYAGSPDDAFGPLSAFARPWARVLLATAPYLSTPPLALARVLRHERCAAVLVQEYEWPRFDVVVAVGRLLRVPVFATFQGGDRHRPSLLEDRLRPLALRATRGLAIATADEAARVERAYGVRPGRIAIVRNPVDPDEWRPVDRDEARASLGIRPATRVAIWHGRIEMVRKGLDVLLDAWLKVIASRPEQDLLLVLVGSGADDAELRRRLADPALSSVRWIAGFELDRTLIRRCLSAADVYVMPSRREGLPVAPLEAMACGLPVAASDIASLAEILGGGVAAGGLTAPAGDRPGFAAILGRFLDDPDLAAAAGRAARRTVMTGFSTAAVAGQLGSMLSACVPDRVAATEPAGSS